MTDIGAACLTVRDLSELDELQDRIRQSADHAHEWIQAQTEPLEMLRAMKFEMAGFDPMKPDRRMNLIEQINQTWTFAVAVEATRKLFELHPNADRMKVIVSVGAYRDLQRIYLFCAEQSQPAAEAQAGALVILRVLDGRMDVESELLR